MSQMTERQWKVWAYSYANLCLIRDDVSTWEAVRMDKPAVFEQLESEKGARSPLAMIIEVLIDVMRSEEKPPDAIFLPDAVNDAVGARVSIHWKGENADPEIILDRGPSAVPALMARLVARRVTAGK